MKRLGSALAICAALLTLPWARADATAEEDAARAVDFFYNLQFDEAFASARALQNHYPHHPAGWFYLGVAYFQRYLIEVPTDPQTLSLFEGAMTDTLRVAGELQKSQPDLYHYYTGAALGFQSRALVAHHEFRRAIPKARQGLSHLKKALALNPHLEDAYMGLGMFDYYTDRIPTAVKPFAYLFVGLWGNHERGMRYLERTAEHGVAARMEALSILASINSSEAEKNWPVAETQYRLLMERYPLNPRYRLGLAYVEERRGRLLEAAALCDPSGNWVASLAPMVRTTAEATARLRLIEILLTRAQWKEAGAELDRLEKAGVPEPLADWARLRRANWLDAVHRRDEAIALYRQMGSKKTKHLAEQFLKDPYPAGPDDVMPKRWPLPVVPE